MALWYSLYMGKVIDLTNNKFGRLTPTKFLGGKGSKWECICECGNIINVEGGHLRKGHTRSCGCLLSDELSQRNYKHGLCKIYRLEYKVWLQMRQRCNNSNDNRYCYYGARGIKVCERWNLFENFINDMGPRPKGLTLERVDNNGHYEPDNCIWASWDQQSKNKRKYGSCQY